MNRLIKLQLRNIFYNKLFYVCLGINILLSPVITFVMSLTTKMVKTRPFLPEVQAFLTTEVGLISMLFITIFCTFDFMEGTAKNIIARGYSKTKFLLSKYIASLIGLFSMYGIIILVTFVLFIKNGLGYQSSMPIMLLFIVFNVVAYTIIYATISFILEKNSSAIIVNLFFPNIVMLVLNIVDSNLHANTSKYWIGNVGEKFLEKPIMSNLSFPLLMFLIYIIACILIGLYVARRKEIK